MGQENEVNQEAGYTGTWQVDRIAAVAARPDVLKIGGSEYHESLVRSYSVLSYVKEMLALNTPAPVILAIIDHIEAIGCRESEEHECEAQRRIDLETKLALMARTKDIPGNE